MNSLLGTYLTHKDRHQILKSLSNITIEPKETDDSLISSVSIYMRDNPPVTRAEVSYQQFGIDLINFLRLNPDDTKSGYVRRALKFLQQPDSTHPFFNNPAIKAFVASFTLHEISGNQTLRFADEIQGLSPDEKQAAEEILLEFAGSHTGEDSELLEYIRHFITSLGEDESTCIVNRFLRNIRKLMEILSSDRDWTDEQKAWARGALRYIQLKEDAISDDLGIIGLLDDMYIAAIAVRFIEPIIQPIEEVISDLYKVWPFLRDLVLTHNDTEYTYSEFALINAALACPALTAYEDSKRFALILPSSGITPFIIAFGAALGVAYDAAGSANDTASFTLGQKVRVDSDAVAIYDGMDEVGGAQYIRLKQYSVRKGQTLSTIYRIPADQVGRLCPVSGDAALRGKIPMQIDDAEISLAGTEALFHLSLPQQFNRISGRVWLVTQTSSARALASGVRLYGHPLSGVLPMGHVKRDGEIVLWDMRFGTSESLVTVISDLDLAAELLEEQDLTIEDLVVIDLSGTNRNKFASLVQIQSLAARVLCIAEEKDTDIITKLEEKKYGLWEWSAKEIEELYVPNKQRGVSAHPFQINDAAVFKSILLSPDIVIINSSEAENAKNDLDLLAQNVRKAGEDAPEEIREIYDELLDIAFGLFRTPVPLGGLDGGLDGVINSFERLLEKSRRSIYLKDEERELVSRTIESLQYFAVSLEDGNPKADVISEITERDTSVSIVMPSRFPSRVSLLQNAPGDSSSFLPWQRIRDTEYESLIIPYWPGRRKAWDIYSRPPSRKICFVLYSFEDEWRSAFYKKRNRSRDMRAQHTHRSTIFTRKHKWAAPPAVIPEPVRGEGSREEDALIEERDFRFRQRLVHATRREGEVADTKARLLVFRGGAHAFFTLGHEAWSATHLLSAPSDDSGNEEKLLAVKIEDIAEDDVLVFLRGTNRDAIRELADTNLLPGTRETARLWQKSLRAYVDEKGLSLTELKRQLERTGCKRHVVTLKQWLESETLIGPRNYASGDLAAIAELTGDRDFQGKMGECANAISKVWGEHLRASNTIAERVLSSIESKITAGLNLATPLYIGDGLVLAQVEYIENEFVMVPISTVNQLKEYV